MKNTINLKEQLETVTQNAIDAICTIRHVPLGLLPHTVFVEEENSNCEPYYRKYQMVDIDPEKGNCIVHDHITKLEEEFALRDINIDWLITFWNRYLELSLEDETSSKELCVFLFPQERFHRNATDEEIIAVYESDEEADSCVVKCTPDEFAAMVNDGDFHNQHLYTRFIYY